jgi:hypothetical protein
MERRALLAVNVLDADQPVADAALGHDMLGLRRVAFKFLPQVPHVNSQVMVVISTSRPPHFLKELVMGEHAPWVPRETRDARHGDRSPESD